MDNVTKQAEEIEVLISIYGDEWKTESQSDRRFSMSLFEGGRQVTLYFHLPENYPLDSPPSVEMSAPLLTRQEKDQIHEALKEIHSENIGETVLYQWVEKVREILQSLPVVSEDKLPTTPSRIHIEHEFEEVPCPDITHGEIIEDRKSVFQAHVARISNPDDVNAVLWNIKLERKIASATHNITAWRCGAKHDCDDDGEKSAGSRLLRLLELAKVDNVVIVVSRWYGGVHLGPDRFRHINDAARQVLVQARLLAR